MDERQFRLLQVGDELKYMMKKYTIIHIEWGYDYSTSPATQYAWEVTFQDHSTARATDNIRLLDVVNVKDAT